MSNKPAPQPRIYFSFRSPYSWLAFRALAIGHPAIVQSAKWIPFWEPDEISQRLLAEAGGRFLYTPMSREKHLYVLRDVKRLVTQRGLAMTWPVDRSPWWEVSHLAYLVADSHGRGLDFIRLVYRARWELGLDISDRTVVGGVASELGLPRKAIEGAVEDEDVRRRGTESLLSIYNDSVFGVPYFVNGREVFWGLDRLESFIASLNEVRNHPPRHEREPVIVDDLKATDFGPCSGCG